MKGIIFNLFESFITDTFSENKYEEIESKTTLITTEPFVGPGTYPDEDLMALVGTATKILDIPTPDAVRAFGKFAFPKLLQKYPVFGEGINHPKEFLLTVDKVIHVEVRKLYKDAETPEFTYEDPAKDRLIMRYKSRRKLCHLAEGLLDGASEYFKIPIVFKQTKCALESGDYCEFDIEFKS